MSENDTKRSGGEDPFRRIDYRRFVAWSKRIEREMPFLAGLFGEPGGLPLIDVGCGTGEHAAALTEKGYDVIGIDRSEAMLEKARAAYDGPTFLRGEMGRLPLSGDGRFGGALCLGNTLVNLIEDDEYLAFFGALRRLLAPGSPFLVQIVNYRKIVEKGIRHLPLNFRESDGKEILYLRLLDRIDEKRIRFELVTLERALPDGESRIVDTVSSVLRALRDDELGDLLGRAGFGDVELIGSYARDPYVPLESHDVIAVAR